MKKRIMNKPVPRDTFLNTSYISIGLNIKVNL